MEKRAYHIIVLAAVDDEDKGSPAEARRDHSRKGIKWSILGADAASRPMNSALSRSLYLRGRLACVYAF